MNKKASLPLISLFAAIALVGFYRLAHPTLWADFGCVILARDGWMLCELLLALRAISNKTQILYNITMYEDRGYPYEPFIQNTVAIYFAKKESPDE